MQGMTYEEIGVFGRYVFNQFLKAVFALKVILDCAKNKSWVRMVPSCA
jgi:hypothetical protein